ncbi:non-ribosomal peptide synthetase [Micromonospora sp. NPDC049645]|uniref:non-ribosomal peptide synthetase n=1 Tax=Micromonospora sp. NPDC049645 TaxID=3155508 RepID=UPI00341A587B
MSLKAICSTTVVDHLHRPCEGFPPAVADSFRFWAEQAPQRPALETGDLTMSYRELDRRSVAVAARLREAGVRAGDVVAVLLPNGADAVAAVLAILRLGAAYVPVSPKDPHAQIVRVLPDAGARVVCADRRWSRLADEGFRVVDVATVHDGDEPVEPHPSRPTDVAYLCYTSGSTGERKAVVVDQGNLAHSTAARRAVYPGAARFYWMSPLHFDSSAAGLWGTLTSGGTLIVADEHTLTDRAAILRSLTASRATQMLCIPALYDAVLREMKRLPEAVPPSLRTVILAGEALPQSVADRHFATFGTRVDLVNEYGPTECTIWASYHRLRPSEPVTIGVPAPGVSIDVVADDLVPVPAGQWGQIMVSGPTVARGYRGGSTAGHGSPFRQHPDRGAAYLTGDLGRIDDAGRLEFGGRTDDQVKVRGHRIALGEVEQSLLGLDEVRRAAVVQDDGTGELRAFVEPDRGTSAEAVKERLAERVPRHLVPGTVELVDRLPVTSTGKLDRAALRRTAPSAVPVPAGPAGTGTREAVASAWCAVLGTEAVSDDTSFFDAGGTSLLVFALQDALAERLQRRPDVVDLFAHPTIRSQVRLFDSADNTGPDPAAARLAAARRQRVLRSAGSVSSAERLR